jgi:protein AATF/BFR2
MGRKNAINDQLNDQLLRRHELDEDESLHPEVDDIDDDTPPSKHLKTESGRRESKKRLRHRGDLDPSFSEGAYSGVPIAAAEIESRMDDLFGLLEDEADDVNEPSFDNEDDYEKWLNKKNVLRKRARGGIAATSADAAIIQQLEELRSRQLNVVAEKPSDSHEETAETLKKLVGLYGALLQVRMKLQPVVLKAVQIPQHDVLSAFKSSDRRIAKTFSEAGAALRCILQDFAAAGLETFPAKGQTEAVFSAITQHWEANIDGIHKCIEHWGAKVYHVSPAHAQLKSINQPLLDQIRAIIAAKPRLLLKVQKNRFHAKIFGHPSHMFAQSEKDRAAAIAGGDFDAEIFDDGDFVRELVHRAGSASVQLQRSMEKSASTMPEPSRSEKCGFHRKTKGKAVNYDPRPKLVGFMAPQPYKDTQHSAVLSALFRD